MLVYIICDRHYTYCNVTCASDEDSYTSYRNVWLYIYSTVWCFIYDILSRYSVHYHVHIYIVHVHVYVG